MSDPPTIMCLDSAGKPALFQFDCYDDLALLRTPPSTPFLHILHLSRRVGCAHQMCLDGGHSPPYGFENEK